MHHYSVKPLALSLRPSWLLMTVLVDSMLGAYVLLAIVITAGFMQAIWRDVLLQVLAPAYVAPWLSVPHLQVAGRRFARHVVLLPDSLYAETYRQLRVCLKWRRALPDRLPGEKS